MRNSQDSSQRRRTGKQPAVPSEERLLELASASSGGRRQAIATRPASDIASDARFNVILAELRRLSQPPQGLPPMLDRLPGARVLSRLILRFHERLFRKQTMINERITEALSILMEQQRRR